MHYIEVKKMCKTSIPKMTFSQPKTSNFKQAEVVTPSVYLGVCHPGRKFSNNIKDVFKIDFFLSTIFLDT
jgi:hypothetical protein